MNYPELEHLISVIKKLRHPEKGCPWDLAQTHESLLPYLVEESYEYIEAVRKGDRDEMCEELGDVLLQVLLHATIAEQEKRFGLEQVAKKLAEKMIHRHPHVFNNQDKQPTISELHKNWEQLKGQEKAKKPYFHAGHLSFPGLFGAHKIGKKAAKINFDWPGPEAVFKKVQEEWLELQEALAEHQKDSILPPNSKVAEELGDLFFSLAQYCRHLGLDPEEVARDGNRKFIRRFQQLEKLVGEDGQTVQELSREELESYWPKVKKLEGKC